MLQCLCMGVGHAKSCSDMFACGAPGGTQDVCDLQMTSRTLVDNFPVHVRRAPVEERGAEKNKKVGRHAPEEAVRTVGVETFEVMYGGVPNCL